MREKITFSCGHEGYVTLRGTEWQQKGKLRYYEEQGLCRRCYNKKVNDAVSEGCRPVRMPYWKFKEDYPGREVKLGSYRKKDKSIIVYLPLEEEA